MDYGSVFDFLSNFHFQSNQSQNSFSSHFFQNGLR
jgi:hypothetical protein